MLDHRIFTFLELCNLMNYRKTAEQLNMTQPAVTQHIQYLEGYYGCRLFDYTNKKLQKTEKCLQLEGYARSIISLNLTAQERLSHQEKRKINLGATKTIGEYTLEATLHQLFSRRDYQVNLLIENTEKLLERLNHFELDLLLLEGFVDKERYPHQLISTEEIVGICALDHPFAGREITLDQVLLEKTVLREKGSGTRAVLESFLTQQGYSLEGFSQQSVINSNKMIEWVVAQGLAISFVYQVIPAQNSKLSTFRVQDFSIFHEFNYVFLNQTKLEEFFSILSPLPPE